MFFLIFFNYMSLMEYVIFCIHKIFVFSCEAVSRSFFMNFIKGATAESQNVDKITHFTFYLNCIPHYIHYLLYINQNIVSLIIENTFNLLVFFFLKY